MSDRVLVVSSQLPYPGVLHGGGARVLRLIRSLAERYEVDVASFFRAGEEGRIEALKGVCRGEVVVLPLETNVLWTLPQGFLGKARHFFWPPEPDDALVYHAAAMRDALARLSKDRPYRAALVEFPEMGLYLDDLPSGCLRIHDTHEIRSATRRRDLASERRPLWKAYYLSQYLKALRFERSNYPRWDLILTVSEAESARVSGYLRPDQLLTLPVGVFLDEFPYRGVKDAGRDPATLLFVASFRNSANVEGFRWFLQRVLPLIRKEVPDVLVQATASNLTPEVERWREPGRVEFVGPFDDLRGASWKARVSIAPVRLGGGMKTKIPEAMAFGLPVVATTQAAEGLGPTDAVLVEDEPEAFARAVARLVKDEAFAEVLSRRGRRLIEERFDCRKNMEPLLKRLEEGRREA